MDPDRRLQLAQLLLQLNDQQNDIAVQHQHQQVFRQRRQRRWWCKPWLLRRPAFGQFEHLMVEMAVEDPAGIQNFVRCETAMFQEMVERLTLIISKQDTNYRKALDPGLKVAITLCYMASGDSSKSLQYGFRVAYNTMCLLIAEVCAAIVEAYHKEVILTPTTPEDWMVIANNISRMWQYHHCLGANDGKHVAIRKPMNGGSYHYNYKNFHSIIFMDLVDGDYKFTRVEVGANGTSSDAQIFEDCGLKQVIDQHVIGFLPPDHLPDDDRDTPYAFPLHTYMMKPYGRLSLEGQKGSITIELAIAEERLWYPGQKICLSAECHQVPAKDSHQYCPRCYLLSQSHAHDISCDPECHYGSGI